MPRAPRYLSAPDAAAALGVTLPTLYAYVSRGLVRSEPGTGKTRARRYHAEDVRRLQERKAHRGDPERTARAALRLGAPVLESAITRIEDGRFAYRGHDAVELARTATFEAVCELVWTGALAAPAGLGAVSAPAEPYDPAHPAESLQRLLAAEAAGDAGAYDLRAERVVRAGARMVRLLTAGVCGGVAAGETVAAALGRAWAPAREEARALLEAALVLCVDHELNASAFTARCAASAGATPYGVVVAGLSALAGARQSGGEVERVEALFAEAAAAADVRGVLASRLRRGDEIPGFRHPLYPDGDPRAAALLSLLRDRCGAAPPVALAGEVASAAEALIGERPVVDFALVAVSRALGLPTRAALAVFAIGRTAGFVGHALEQYGTPGTIRPRARYTGPAVPRPRAPVHA